MSVMANRLLRKEKQKHYSFWCYDLTYFIISLQCLWPWKQEEMDNGRNVWASLFILLGTVSSRTIDSFLILHVGALGNAEYSFIAIAPRSTLARSGSTWKGLIYGPNRTVYHLNWVQTNDLLEIELFGHLTVCKFHHHHGVSLARIFLTLSRYSSLPTIALGRSSMLYPVSVQSYWRSYLPTPPLGQDMTQGQFLSGV